MQNIFDVKCPHKAFSRSSPKQLYSHQNTYTSLSHRKHISTIESTIPFQINGLNAVDQIGVFVFRFSAILYRVTRKIKYRVIQKHCVCSIFTLRTSYIRWIYLINLFLHLIEPYSYIILSKYELQIYKNQFYCEVFCETRLCLASNLGF